MVKGREEAVLREFRDEDQGQVMVLHIQAMSAIGVYKGDGPWDDDLRNIPRNYPENRGGISSDRKRGQGDRNGGHQNG